MNQTQTRPCHSSSKRPPRPKPKGNGQPIRTRGPLANGRTVEGAPRTERFFFFVFCAPTRGGRVSPAPWLFVIVARRKLARAVHYHHSPSSLYCRPPTLFCLFSCQPFCGAPREPRVAGRCHAPLPRFLSEVIRSRGAAEALRNRRRGGVVASSGSNFATALDESMTHAPWKSQ